MYTWYLNISEYKTVTKFWLRVFLKNILPKHEIIFFLEFVAELHIRIVLSLNNFLEFLYFAYENIDKR